MATPTWPAWAARGIGWCGTRSAGASGCWRRPCGSPRPPWPSWRRGRLRPADCRLHDEAVEAKQPTALLLLVAVPIEHEDPRPPLLGFDHQHLVNPVGGVERKLLVGLVVG